MICMAVCAKAHAEKNTHPDFETEVIPVLTKAGCNSAACHGAAIGRGGFRLSLLGYDPEKDYDRLVYEFKGRRVNLKQPDKSLILRKPSRELRHEGGRRLPAGSERYEIVEGWIEAGAPRRSVRSLKSLHVSPSTQTMEKIGETLQIRVTARFSDGSESDVTRWAVYTPDDKEAVKCSSTGELTAMRRGQSSVMVRFLGEVGCVTISVPLSDDPVTSDRPRRNFIDDHVNRTLDQLRLSHSPRASDSTYVRRIYLDLIGTLPSRAEVKEFLADRAQDKRDRLVKQLMSRPEFVDFWSYKWGDLLRVESRRLSQRGASAFHQWIRDRISAGTPLDEFARQLITAEGDAFALGPANFHRVPEDPLEEAEYVSQVFLGVRLQCANCHNHPLDRWTQDDYHGLAAVFARVRREQVVSMETTGELIHPRTKKPAVPRIPGATFLATDPDPRHALAQWMTGKANPFFARAIVNRIWRELMGRGLVEPVDDHRATNPGTHPQLLDALALDFVEHGFDLRHLIRTIVASEAYQRSSLSTGNNAADNRFYSKALVRPLPATVMVDAVSTVTGVPEQLGTNPSGTRAISLGDTRVPSQPLDLLGRCDRLGGCTTEVQTGNATLPLTLHIVNGNWLNQKIESPDGYLQKWLRESRGDEELISSFYKLALCRPPETEELQHWKTKLQGEDQHDRNVLYADFLWALLNAAEFCCNH
jgi:hypothetical protein